MILVVGGLASGKRAFAESLGAPADACALDVHEAVRDADDAQGVEGLVERLAALDVVTCAEVGAGIVPLDAGERAWRERVGTLARLLAERADTVVRMVCGIPTALKGDLPLQASASAFDEPSSSAGDADPFPRTIELYLFRHGQTPGNAARRYVGAIDEPLSDAGREQARAARHFPDVGRVYVSKMRRAQETAAIMFPHAEQVTVEGVEEMDFGAFGGRSADDMVDDAAYRAWVEGNCEGRCPGGESRDEFTERICAAVTRLCHAACARGERTVYLVAHGGTMMATLHRFAVDDSRSYYEWLLGNCEGYRLTMHVPDDGPLKIMSNDRIV